jgi:hypothetical protein
MSKNKATFHDENDDKVPPNRSRGVFSDICSFLMHRPAIPTLIEFNSDEERENYSKRIMQRLGIDVEKYVILNIHKIGICTPAKYVFEELLEWNGDSTCWPNNIAAVERVDGSLEHIHIYLFGWKKYPPFFKKGIFGLKYIPLFDLDAIKFKHLPDPSDFDSARYLLYRCSGGYPIGIFAIYVRSSIAPQGEKEQTQMFMVVGFNFYGREDWSRYGIIHKTWERVHNRVTANIINRFKQLCEWRFQKIQHPTKHHFIE